MPENTERMARRQAVAMANASQQAHNEAGCSTHEEEDEAKPAPTLLSLNLLAKKSGT
jgi:hypothetical protein